VRSNISIGERAPCYSLGKKTLNRGTQMRGREPNWGRNDYNMGSQEGLGVADVFQEKEYKITKLMVSYIMWMYFCF